MRAAGSDRGIISRGGWAGSPGRERQACPIRAGGLFDAATLIKYSSVSRETRVQSIGLQGRGSTAIGTYPAGWAQGSPYRVGSGDMTEKSCQHDMDGHVKYPLLGRAMRKGIIRGQKPQSLSCTTHPAGSPPPSAAAGGREQRSIRCRCHPPSAVARPPLAPQLQTKRHTGTSRRLLAASTRVLALHTQTCGRRRKYLQPE